MTLYAKSSIVDAGNNPIELDPIFTNQIVDFCYDTSHFNPQASVPFIINPQLWFLWQRRGRPITYCVPMMKKIVALLLLIPGISWGNTLPHTDWGPTRPPASTICRGGYSWPTGHPVPIVRSFDPPPQKWSAGHRGVDLAYQVGEAIVAPADGTVVYSGEIADVGVISIDHHNGIRSTYQPVSNQLPVGTDVTRGQKIAKLVSGHDNDALHWGAKISADDYINPLHLIYGCIRLKA